MGDTLNKIAGPTMLAGGLGMLFPDKAMEAIAATKTAVSNTLGAAGMSIDQAIMAGGVGGVFGLGFRKLGGWTKTGSALGGMTVGGLAGSMPIMATLGASGLMGMATGKVLEQFGMDEKWTTRLGIAGAAAPIALPLLAYSLPYLATAASAVAGSPLAMGIGMGALVTAGSYMTAKNLVYPGIKGIWEGTKYIGGGVGNAIGKTANFFNPFSGKRSNPEPAAT